MSPTCSRMSDKENIREIGPGSGISARAQIQKLELTQRLKNLMRAIRSSGRTDRANAGLTLCTNCHGKACYCKQSRDGWIWAERSYLTGCAFTETTLWFFVSQWAIVHLLCASCRMAFESSLQLQYKHTFFVW